MLKQGQTLNKDNLNRAFLSKTAIGIQIFLGGVNFGGSLTTSNQLVSTIATGTSPLSVLSTTLVTNLNADMVDGFHLDQDVRTTASPTHVRLILSQATGTAPMTITSTTLVTNLNADMVDGYHTSVGTSVNSIPVRDASSNITTRQFISDVATGTAPLSVVSTTKVVNLNADTVDGYNFNQGVQTTDSPTFVNLILNAGSINNPGNTGASILERNSVNPALYIDQKSTGTIVEFRSGATPVVKSGINNTGQFVSFIATGTSPFSITSTTVNTNLNADMTDGFHLNQDVRSTASPTFVDVTASNFIITGGMGFKIGDDARIGDVDVANMLGIQGIQDATLGGIVFGSGKDTNLYRSAANTLKTDDSLVVVGSVTVSNKVKMQYNATENSLDFIFI